MSVFQRLVVLQKNHPLWSLVVLRISIGVMFAVAASAKISGGAQWPDRMLGFLNFHADKSYGFYRSFLEAVVIPNKDLFGYLVAYGELFVALSLVLGLLTRCGAAIGLFMVVNFLLAKGSPFWIPSANDPVYILALFTLLFSQSGRLLAVDSLLRGRIELWRNASNPELREAHMTNSDTIGG